jgi:hypothetical protein
MNCRIFIERLDDLLEGRLGAADRLAAEAHLESCAGCRDWKSLVAGAAVPAAPPADLLAAVLARTSGPACGSARVRLCDHVDRLLAPVDDEILRLHLHGCVECGGLATALARLAMDLPPLAEREPGARFVPDVLALTTRRAPLPVRWTTRLAEGWGRLAQRPRIAWEGAYAGAIVLAILFGTPSAPFAGVPGKALDLVRAARVSLPAGAVQEQAPRIRLAVRSRWRETKTEIDGARCLLTGGLKKRSCAAWAGLKQEVGTVWSRIASSQTTNATKQGEHK